jgi:5-methylcytosine-specific restriction endonuclease McrA
MHQQMLVAAARLSDEELLARMQALSGQSREVTVELIAHLVQVARRGLHRSQGPGKLFGYLTGVLHFSEAAAWNRIQAARAVRRFPDILDLLADGTINLTTIRLLNPHLTRDNHRSLMEEAPGKGKSEIKKIVARIAPKPDVATTVRKLPAPSVVTIVDQPAPSGPLVTGEPASAAPVSVAPAAPAVVTRPDSQRPIVEPLAPERYRLQMTMDEQAHDDLRWLQDALRREIPNGDAAVIVARAIRELRQRVEKKAFAATAAPHKSRGTRPGSRDIPAAVERAAWARDGGQCAFVAANGTRCNERSYLEYHHVDPYVGGGAATTENIALRCREHNEYESELLFGRYQPPPQEWVSFEAAETCSGTRFQPFCAAR